MTQLVGAAGWRRAQLCDARRRRSPEPILLVVNRASMTHRHDEHQQPVLLQLTDDAIIAHPVPPQSKLAGPKRLAELARVLGCRNPRIHVIEDFALNRAVELLEILQSSMIVFNRPSQVFSALAGW